MIILLIHSTDNLSHRIKDNNIDCCAIVTIRRYFILQPFAEESESEA